MAATTTTGAVVKPSCCDSFEDRGVANTICSGPSSLTLPPPTSSDSELAAFDNDGAAAAGGTTDDTGAATALLVPVPLHPPLVAGSTSDTDERRRISSVREREAGGGGGTDCLDEHFASDFGCEWAAPMPLVIDDVVVALAVAVAP